MATDNHLTQGHTAIPNQLLLRNGAPAVTTLSGNITLTRKSSQILHLDPGGAGRTVGLPTATSDLNGLWFLISNAADAAEDLTVTDAGAIIGQGEVAVIWCTGAAWDATQSLTTALVMRLRGSTNGLILDADGDTSISAPTDDQIDFEAGGTDRMVLTSALARLTDGVALQLEGNGTGTGDIVQRVGGSATEGLELRVYEETVSPAAVETNLLNTPAGAVILSVQGNVETALTGGGTTVTWALGIAADPDKYGYPGSDTLAQNSKVDTIPDWAVLAASEQMVLTGAATGGTADGDTALTVGSVRVRVVYYALNSLDDA